MKVRIKGNSLRYRLTRSEVATLWKEGFVEEQTAFIGKTFVYGIETGDDKLSAEFTGDKIILRMPRAMIEALHDTEQVGFDGKSGEVALLVEKDFACIERVEEDQRDNYPNPHQC